MEKNVDIIIVSYNDAELLRRVYLSIRRFYPGIHIIIVDGSPEGSPCYNEAFTLMNDAKCTVLLTRTNIGHGKGLNHGIKYCKGEYFITMDSDAEIIRDGIIEVLSKKLLNGQYGIGQVVKVNEYGSNVKEGGMDYLHPHFALINLEQYYMYPAFVHHGAPFISVAKALKGKLGMFKNFEDLSLYVKHDGRGTREQNPKEFHPSTWEL